jgi:hypothetical protein
LLWFCPYTSSYLNFKLAGVSSRPQTLLSNFTKSLARVLSDCRMFREEHIQRVLIQSMNFSKGR